MSPETLFWLLMYGDFFDRATWIEAGPQSMKLASFRSRILYRLLWICVASTSPWMMFKIDMYTPFFVEHETMMFFCWRRRRMTSSTVVLRMEVFWV